MEEESLPNPFLSKLKNHVHRDDLEPREAKQDVAEVMMSDDVEFSDLNSAFLVAAVKKSHELRFLETAIRWLTDGRPPRGQLMQQTRPKSKPASAKTFFASLSSSAPPTPRPSVRGRLRRLLSLATAVGPHATF
jgi:hypothetical protein